MEKSKRCIRVVKLLPSPTSDLNNSTSSVTEDDSSSGLVIHLNKRGAKKRKTTDDSWWAHFTLLLQYKDRYGHYDVPRLYEVCSDDDGVLRALGVWLEKQRQRYFMGQMKGDEFFAVDQIVKAGELWSTATTLSTLSTCDDSILPAPGK